jgi:phage shock protein PspC (stress-responsive transcriptional regulator)
MSPIASAVGQAHSGPMTTTEEHPPVETPPSEPGVAGPDLLRRSSSRRLVAGVAGGIAERFDIDVTIVRVAFVVAACFWGLGAVIYLAMWALLPPDPSVPASPVTPPAELRG